MSSESTRPPVSYVGGEDGSVVDGAGVTWYSAINAETVGCTEFEFGHGRLEAETTASITPNNQFSEEGEESAAMITRGEAIVRVDGDEAVLRPYDSLFVPPDATYELRSGSEEVGFLWGAATNDKDPLSADERPLDHGGTAQIVRPIRDLEPNVTLEPGQTSRHWPAVFPETAGSARLNLGLFMRPPGSAIDMHGHDPPSITEAFTVIEGRLLVGDQRGNEFVLGPGDYVYVPEDGMHNNKNVGTGDVTYACIETPARSRIVSPVK